MRPLHQPQGNASALVAGRAVFEANCASCHGGAKWTKSEIFHRDNPAVASPRTGHPWTSASPGSRCRRWHHWRTSSSRSAATLSIINYLEDVGTFDVTNPLEIRDNAVASTAFGVNGFNSSSLLSINYHAPYLHRGQAQTLPDVFPLHTLPALGGGTIADTLNAPQQADLLAFLKSIDGTTAHLPSAGDIFRDGVRAQGTCPPLAP